MLNQRKAQPNAKQQQSKRQTPLNNPVRFHEFFIFHSQHMNIVFIPAAVPMMDTIAQAASKSSSRARYKRQSVPPPRQLMRQRAVPGRRSFGEELRAYPKNCQTPCRLACSQKAGSQAATDGKSNFPYPSTKAALIYSRSPAFAFSHKESFRITKTYTTTPVLIEINAPDKFVKLK